MWPFPGNNKDIGLKKMCPYPMNNEDIGLERIA